MPSNRSTARLSEPVILCVRRFWPGVVAAVISLSLAVLGTIALVRWDESRIPRTVLGIVCWGGAFSSARTGVCNLCGTLTVDAEGIRLEPRVVGPDSPRLRQRESPAILKPSTSQVSSSAIVRMRRSRWANMCGTGATCSTPHKHSLPLTRRETRPLAAQRQFGP